MTAYLVGAGPGDPGLLTLRAQELIARADVILYDLLIGPEILAGAREDAELIFVGKQGGGPQVPQVDTNALLIEHSTAGREVVRLKGGDPLVFGRGSEEAQVLRAAGVRYEIVPGITSGIAAPAYAGIPVTHRDVAAGVAFVTGHQARDGAELDWDALARFPGTLVFYMAVKALPRLSEALIAAGRPADEPVAVVERGTLADQRVTHATLATVGDGVGARALPSPSSARSPRSVRSWPGASCGRCTIGASPSPAPGRRPRRWRPGCATSAREVVEAPAIRTRSLEARAAAARPVTTCSSSPRPTARTSCSPCSQRAGRRRAHAGRSPDRRDGPGHRARAARARHRRRRRAGPLRCRRHAATRSPDTPLSSVLLFRAREGRDTLPEGLRARGVPVRSCRSTRRCPSRSSDPGRLAASTGSPSRRPRPCASSPTRPAAFRRGRGWPRSARRPPPRSASSAANPTSRPTRTHRTASSTRSWRYILRMNETPRVITFLSDYGLADEFVGVVHAVIARHRARGTRHRPRPRRPSAGRPRGRARCSSARCHSPHQACIWPWSTRRSARGDGPSPLRTAEEDRLLVGPDNGLLMLAAHTLRWVRRGRRDLALAVAAGAGVGDLPRPRRLRTRRRAAGRRRSTRRGRRADRDRRISSVSIRRAPRSPTARSSRTSSASTASATCCSTPRTTTRARPCASDTRSRSAITAGTFARTFADVAAGALVLYEDSSRRLAIAVNSGSAAEHLELMPATGCCWRRDDRPARATTCVRSTRPTLAHVSSPSAVRRTERS